MLKETVARAAICPNALIALGAGDVEMADN